MKKENVFKILKIIGSVIFYLIIVIMLFYSIATISVDKKSKYREYPTIFGTGFLTIQTDSMESKNKNSLFVGDMIFVKKPSKKDISKLKVGDIITFYDHNLVERYNNGELSNCLDTHRIVYIDKVANSFVTQGDKIVEMGYKYIEPEYDADGHITNEEEFIKNYSFQQLNYYQEISASDILGIYKGKWGGFGNFTSFLHDSFWFTTFPLFIILLGYEVFVVIRNIKAYQNEKNGGKVLVDNEAMKLELEAQKEAMRKEIMEQLRKEALEKENSKEEKEENKEE